MSIQDEEARRLAEEADENMAAWEAGIQRIKADLLVRHPEFFDESGELKMKEVSQLMQQIADERGLTLTELYIETSRSLGRRAAASPSPDASPAL